MCLAALVTRTAQSDELPLTIQPSPGSHGRSEQTDVVPRSPTPVVSSSVWEGIYLLSHPHYQPGPDQAPGLGSPQDLGLNWMRSEQ